ncbi:MAG TPA: macro domain-containing protein [Candidatus Hydrogenedentes bacterium]|nr:macro domain-containing protein [Candidatus Hydrogenedentota bacterium]HPG67350.1 macro domain-containing protein [Candidatus Hydrogenedentota bacterium]
MKVLVGDLFQSKAQTLINTVNCVGVMGKGIALEFKKRFPDMFEDYARRCARGQVKPGIPYLYRSVLPPQIVNFPTKDHWKSVSRIEDVRNGLKYLADHFREWEITSLAMPPLGCGNGQLEWRVVGPMIYRYATLMDIPVELYAPYGTPPRELTRDFLSQVPRCANGYAKESARGGLNAAWIALVEIIRRLENQPYCWPVGRTIFQKIAFVATREGLPTGLQYEKGSFGPFSGGLKAVQTRLVNDSLLQEERLGRMFRVTVGPNYERLRKGFEGALSQWTAIIERTTDLFTRMDTSRAEIAATILFAADALARERTEPPLEGEVLASVMEWKQKRRPPLSENEVATAIRNLAMLHWLNVRFDPQLPAQELEVV